jgi:membrane fusion protein, multidrug efflux system
VGWLHEKSGGHKKEIEMRRNPAILAFVAIATLAAACGDTKIEQEVVRPVIAQKISTGAIATRDVYSGEVRARYETDLAFRIAGKIAARPVDAGARVTKGQALARLDPQDARLAQDAARAQVASAESELVMSRAEMDRYADLLAKKFISQSAFDAKQNAFNTSAAKAEQMRSQAAISANQANYTTLAADADGVIVSVTAEPGQVVAAGQSVMRLAHAGEMDVVLNAPENQLARFKVGEEVLVTLWADPQTVFPGRIREVAGGADPVTRTFMVKVAIARPPQAVQVGMTANVAFKAQASDTMVLLPLSALAGTESDPAVWVVDATTNQVKRRSVKVGQFREDGVTISSGLQAGETVVTAGVHKLRANQVVRVAIAAR